MKKNVLIVSPVPTHPPISGNRARIYSFVSCLKDMGCDVHFLHIEREKGSREEMQQVWGKSYQFAEYHRPKKNLMKKLVNKIKLLFDNHSRYQHSIDDWWDDSSRNLLLDLQNKYNFDAVIAEYVFFSKALTYFPSTTLKIVDTHDVYTDRYKHFLENNLKPIWFSTTKNEEKKALDRADVVIAIQDKERFFFSEMTKSSVITIGHLVALVPPVETKEPHKILYVASNNTNNIESINWFINEAFVKIKNILPKVELLIAGTICDCLSDMDGLVKLGVVDELGDIYKQADVVINPMKFGTGLKIKNVEALGFSKPLVSSSVAAAGLEDGEAKAYLLADDAQQYVDSITKVLSDEKFYEELSTQAYEYAANWNKNILASFERVLNA